MVVAVALPLQVVHAQPVHQQQDPAAGARDGGGQMLRREDQRLAVVPQLHGYGEGIGAGGEVVAQYAVERGKDGFARRGGRCQLRFEQRQQLAKQGVDAAADQSGRALDAAIDQSGDAAGRFPAVLAEGAGRAGDVVVHALDQTGQTYRGVDREAAVAANVSRSDMALPGHG